MLDEAVFTAGDLMTRDVATVRPDASLLLAPEFLRGIQEQNRKVNTVMTRGTVTVAEDTPAREIAQLMHANQIRRVPVVRDGKLVGIVTRTDLVRALAQRLEEMSSEQTGEHGASVNEALRRGREESGGARGG